MNSTIFFSTWLLALTACQSNSTPPVAQEVAALKAPNSGPAPESGLAATNPERIQDTMLTVNGLRHRELTTQLLERQLGRPDSIKKGAVECGGYFATETSPEGDWWYYGNTMYEVNGTRAILYSFDVTTGKFKGKLGKLILDQNTTLEDVRRFYPLSAKEAEKPASGQRGEEMSLPFEYKGEMMDDSLILLFRKGRLQEVVFFSPC
ncbi:hypothetical protein [Hymenobacter gelipurpurascens]|nr:hypothetical protein [Hymenobacter gelipurpurascens]